MKQKPEFEELHKLYKKYTITEMASIFKVSSTTVWHWLQSYKIDTHKKWQRNKIGIVKKCKYCGKKFYVPPNRLKSNRGKYHSKICFYRDRFNTEKLKDKVWLENESNTKTMQQIAKELQCNIGSIHYWRKKFGISSKLRPSDNIEWKPTRIQTPDGYIRLQIGKKNPYYRMSDNGKILEHRLVIAKHLGRCLETWEIVHHKNRIRDDNRIENLELIPSQSKHLSIIFMEKRIKELEERVSLLELENQLLLEKIDNGKSKLVRLEITKRGRG